MSRDYAPFPIADIRYGKYLAKKPWLSPPDAFQSIINAYVDKGILKKRSGYSEWARFVHEVTEVVGTGDGSETEFLSSSLSHPIDFSTLTVTHGEEPVVETFTPSSDFLPNGGMELWSAGDTSAPDNWTFDGNGAASNVSKESSIKQQGSFSAKLTSGTGSLDYAAIKYTIASAFDVSLWVGKTITVSAWVWADTAMSACISIQDGVSWSADYHTGDSTWQYLSFSYTVLSGATGINVYCASNANAGAATAYFDECYISIPGIVRLDSDLGGTGWADVDNGEISVTCHTAPGEDVDLLASFSYYAGNPIMGIFEHFRPTSRDLLVFDTKRMCKYNTTSLLLEDVTGADTWTGQDDDFFHCLSATDDNFYITNGVDQIQKWTGSALSAFVIDYTGGSSNKVNTCKFIFEYYGHLLILAPTEEGTYRGRRWRCSTAGTFTTWPSYCYGDAPTPDEIMGAAFIDKVLYVWFKESLWRLNYTGIYTLPFEWEKVSDEEGLYASFSPVVAQSNCYGIGRSSFIVTDGVKVYQADDIIPDELLTYQLDKIGYAYGSRVRELRHIWWTFCGSGSTHPNKVLAFDYKNGNYFPFDLAVHCLGTFTSGSTLNIDDIDEDMDDIDYSWDSAPSVAGYPLTLGGLYDGYVVSMNTDGSDDGAAIEFMFETMELNPFVKEGLEARLGWVDFLVTSNDATELTISFSEGHDLGFYKSDTLDFSDTRNRALVWKRIHVGCVGPSHRIKGLHNVAGQPVEIHAIVPYFKPGGRLR